MVKRTRESTCVVNFLLQISLLSSQLDKRYIIMKISLSMVCLFTKCVSRLSRSIFYSTLLNKYTSNNTLRYSFYLVSTQSQHAQKRGNSLLPKRTYDIYISDKMKYYWCYNHC